MKHHIMENAVGYPCTLLQNDVLQFSKSRATCPEVQDDNSTDQNHVMQLRQKYAA